MARTHGGDPSVTDRHRRELWVLRHAKAGAHTVEDHGRTLTGRGRRQCAELVSHLTAGGTPDTAPRLLLVSSATRARDTAERVLQAFGDGARIEIEPALYEADAEEVIELVRQVDDELRSVMVVGHNPTLEGLLWLLVEDDGGRELLRGGLSTGALAVVGFDSPSWAALKLGTGRLLSLYSPTAR